jgi:hypothetical protein
MAVTFNLPISWLIEFDCQNFLSRVNYL